MSNNIKYGNRQTKKQMIQHDLTLIRPKCIHSATKYADKTKIRRKFFKFQVMIPANFPANFIM